MNFLRLVPKKERRGYAFDEPRTPNKNTKHSKRGWDGIIRKWRRTLHKWDDRTEEKGDAKAGTKRSAETQNDSDVGRSEGRRKRVRVTESSKTSTSKRPREDDYTETTRLPASSSKRARVTSSLPPSIDTTKPPVLVNTTSDVIYITVPPLDPRDPDYAIMSRDRDL